MAERSRPALDGPGGSPLPEGYGSLNDAAPGTGGPERPRRPGRRLPQARSTVAADARQAETRAETRAAEEEERAAEARAAKSRATKARAAEARAARARAAEARAAKAGDAEARPAEAEAGAEREAADAQAAGQIRADQQGAEPQLVTGRRSEAKVTGTRQRDAPAAAGSADPTLSAVQEANPETLTRVQEQPSRASDAQAAEQWAAQRREAVQESRRAAADLQGGGPGPSAAATTIGLPLAAPVQGAGATTAASAARSELWVEEDDGVARFRRRQKVRVVRSTSSRRLVRRIDTWTVFKVSFLFYVLALIILVVAGVILWNVAEAFGTIASIQKSAKSLFDLSHFVIKPIPLLEYTTGGGAILCVLGTVLNTVVALLYNLISDVIGGVQVVVVTEPD
jgi:hypothetical protein